MHRIILIALAATAIATPALADSGRLPPVTHEATRKECSACHMAFQPQMLPARSWEALMRGLDNHFGEDASLPPEVVADITAYLTANAADAGGNSRWMRGIGAGDTPLRITETPMWLREHRGEVSDSALRKAGSKANCTACHRGADQGYYDDD